MSRSRAEAQGKAAGGAGAAPVSSSRTVRVPRAGSIGSIGGETDRGTTGNQWREMEWSRTGGWRCRSRPEAAEAEGGSGGDDDAGEKRNERESARAREGRERRKEWLGRTRASL